MVWKQNSFRDNDHITYGWRFDYVHSIAQTRYFRQGRVKRKGV